MTTGGTESIMMACKAYRDYGKEVNGITKPNIVMPRTAHSGFDKAAQYLGIYIRYVDVDPETTEADVAKMKRAINRNTIMVWKGFRHSLERSRFSKGFLFSVGRLGTEFPVRDDGQHSSDSSARCQIQRSCAR